MLEHFLYGAFKAIRPAPDASAEEVIRFFRSSICQKKPSRIFLKGQMVANQEQCSGVDVTSLVKPGHSKKRILLYLHSGAYIGGPFMNEWEFISYFASRMQVNAIVPDYALAPEKPYPAAYEEVSKIYENLCDHYQEIILIGASAGGGLALALANRIVAEQRLLPKAQVLISPWVNLASSSLKSLRNKTDVFLNSGMLSQAADAYAFGHELHNPEISPLFAENQGLPPTYISGGSYEIFADDLESLAAVFQENKILHKLHIRENKQHIWPTFLMIPEAKKEIRNIEEFCLAHL